MNCKSNDNSYHDGTSAFFRCFFPKKTRTLMSLTCRKVLQSQHGHSVFQDLILFLKPLTDIAVLVLTGKALHIMGQDVWVLSISNIFVFPMFFTFLPSSTSWKKKNVQILWPGDRLILSYGCLKIQTQQKLEKQYT